MLVYLIFECEIKLSMKFSTLYIYNSSSIIMKTDTTHPKTFPLKDKCMFKVTNENKMNDPNVVLNLFRVDKPEQR